MVVTRGDAVPCIPVSGNVVIGMLRCVLLIVVEVTDGFNSGVCLRKNIVKKCVPGQDEWVEASVYKGISAKVSAI
jgi:hypothetical protein